MLRILKIFLAGLSTIVVAFLACTGYLYVYSGGFDEFFSSVRFQKEAYAHQAMKDLSVDHVISVCGKPASDVVVDYGDRKSRILVYRDFEADFSLKEGHWQYDFMKDGDGRMPDARMVKRHKPIKLPCQR